MQNPKYNEKTTNSCSSVSRIRSNLFKKTIFEQKQPSRGVLRKRCSENMQQIYRRALMPKCDFNKGQYTYNVHKNWPIFKTPHCKVNNFICVKLGTHTSFVLWITYFLHCNWYLFVLWIFLLWILVFLHCNWNLWRKTI